ncbi:MAG TPA: cytochrome P450 [Flavilitoribacter sp.]|nr:cytochrome P450 [Flavilitoribacter sp.]
MQIPTVPRWRSLVNATRFVANPAIVLTEYIREFGPTFYVYIGGMKKGVVTIEPHIIQHFLQKNNRNYRKSSIQVDRLGHFLGQGLLTSDGDYWLRQRRLIQPGFHRSKLEGLREIMQEVIDEFADSLQEEARKGTEIEVAHKMMELAFKVVARSLFSADLLEAKLQELSQSITQLQSFIVRQIRQPYLNPWFYVSGALRRHEQIARDADQIILDVIRERRQSDGEKNDLLQMLLDVRYEDSGEPMTDRQLLDESKIIFVAGHETTANALAWTWYLLSRRPEVVTKIREELDRVTGGSHPGFADLPRLEYTTAVIEESMRLYPPAWITDRQANEADEVGDLKVPKDAIVVPFIYGVHHSERLWEDPEAFNPDRFAKEEKNRMPPYSYMPFGGGPRLCIGNSFALMEMQLILATLLRRFDIELVPDQTIEAQPLVTLRPRYGIRMRFKPLTAPLVQMT